MVNHEQRRARYVPTADGAPPVPPPGGYRGARRAADPFASIGQSSAVAIAPAEPAEKTGGALGWIAFVGGVLFALTLFGAAVAGGVDLVYSTTMLVLQLLVAGVAIAAVCTRGGRVLGAVALTIALVVNIGTMGAMGALQASAGGDYEGVKSDEQRHAEAYPGIKGQSATSVLTNPSLEEVRAHSEALIADIRERLSDRYGYTWAEAGDENLRPERNGYGGESMLTRYTSEVWATNEPIQDDVRKRDVMYVIDEVLSEYDMWGIISLNEPGSGVSDKALEMLYGSADPSTQDTWEWYSDDYPGPVRFYAIVHDLSNDTTGDFRRSRETQSARTGEPLEGLQLMVIAPELLSEADRAEFEDRMQDYPNF